MTLPFSQVGKLTRVSPHCLKVRIAPLHFYRRPKLIAAFANWKKPKEDFRRKVKIEFSVCFAASCDRSSDRALPLLCAGVVLGFMGCLI